MRTPLVTLFAIAALTGGCTNAPTNIESTRATLHGWGTCKTGTCNYHFRVWPVELGEGAAFTTPTKTETVAPMTSKGAKDTVEGLGSHARYAFQFCGKESNETEFRCAAPREFVIALAPPTATPVVTTQITPTADWYGDSDCRFGGSPHGQGHQQDNIIFHGFYLFVPFYDETGRVSLARSLLGTNTWTTLSLDSYVPEWRDPAVPDVDPCDETVPGHDPLDHHDNPAVAISSDGRIHLAYGHHVDDLRYRMSSAGAATRPDTQFTASLFGAEVDNLGGTPISNVTYPVFVNKESDDQLFLFWRSGSSGNGDTVMSRYTGGGIWTSPTTILDGSSGTYIDPTGQLPASHSRNAYPNDIISFDNQLQMTWCWREEGVVAGLPVIPNHDLLYAWSGDNGVTWRNAKGAAVRNNSMEIQLNSPDIVGYDIDYDWSLVNNNSSAADSQNNTHVVLIHAQSAGSSLRRYWHYWRKGATWNRTMIPFPAGARPKIFVDRATDTVYVVAQVNGFLKIYAAQKTTDDVSFTENWGSWHLIHTGGKAGNEPNAQLVTNSLFVLRQPSPTAGSPNASPLEVDWLLVDSDPDR